MSFLEHDTYALLYCSTTIDMEMQANLGGYPLPLAQPSDDLPFSALPGVCGYVFLLSKSIQVYVSINLYSSHRRCIRCTVRVHIWAHVLFPLSGPECFSNYIDRPSSVVL